MLSPDDRPAPPAIPHFSRDMESALVAAARAGSPRRPASAARFRRYAAAGIAAAAIAVAAGAGVDHAVSHGHSAASGGPAGRIVHIHDAAFWVDSNAGGTVSVTLARDHVLDPGRCVTHSPKLACRPSSRPGPSATCLAHPARLLRPSRRPGI